MPHTATFEQIDESLDFVRTTLTRLGNSTDSLAVEETIRDAVEVLEELRDRIEAVQHELTHAQHQSTDR
ncbi:MAG TPA: hypothetical protein VFT66_03490 [Roseiflexaceae bacterium]|jgi:Arc/MetJ family transcription regulator|nr:hypothetical protein [Roseiflexaceae bacterium]